MDTSAAPANRPPPPRSPATGPHGAFIFALNPRSPSRRAAVERHLSDAWAELRALGLHRQQIAGAFLVLSRAARDLLSTSGLPLKRASALMRTIDAQILEGMDWPDTILEVNRRERAAGDGR